MGRAWPRYVASAGAGVDLQHTVLDCGAGCVGVCALQVDMEAVCDALRQRQRQGGQAQVPPAPHGAAGADEGLCSSAAPRTPGGGEDEQSQRQMAEDVEALSRTPFQDVLLRPGQMLYIPPKWWHFVKSASVSFSVSFWWK